MQRDRPTYLPVIQQRNELLDRVLHLFHELGYPLASVNRDWTIDELQEHLAAEHGSIAKPLLFLALSASSIHIMRQVEATQN